MTEPVDPGNGPPETPAGDSSNTPPMEFPEEFNGYELTYLSNTGRAAMAGASDQTLADMRKALYDGWIRPNEYDSQGRETFGYYQRHQARQSYSRIADALEEHQQNLPENERTETDFDWRSWREEYSRQAA